VTNRWAYVASFVFGVIWLGLGIWDVLDGKSGVIRLALGAAWIALGLFQVWRGQRA
jgi:hypothetical protein